MDQNECRVVYTTSWDSHGVSGPGRPFASYDRLIFSVDIPQHTRWAAGFGLHEPCFKTLVQKFGVEPEVEHLFKALKFFSDEKGISSKGFVGIMRKGLVETPVDRISAVVSKIRQYARYTARKAREPRGTARKARKPPGTAGRKGSDRRLTQPSPVSDRYELRSRTIILLR
jgi:hypothetical protein